MKQSLLIAALSFCAAAALARPPVEKADRMKESPENTTAKKKAGEECKTSDECRRHHRCEKAGDKNVCVAPRPQEIPKT